MKLLKVLGHSRFWRVVALFIVDVLFFSRTNSNKVPSYLLMAGFILVVATIYQGVYLLLSIGRFYGIPVAHKKRMSGYISGVIGILLALQSVGELGLRDVLVIIPLALIAYLYTTYNKINKRDAQQNQ
jgi:hypothetical protein